MSNIPVANMKIKIIIGSYVIKLLKIRPPIRRTLKKLISQFHCII